MNIQTNHLLLWTYVSSGQNGLTPRDHFFLQHLTKTHYILFFFYWPETLTMFLFGYNVIWRNKVPCSRFHPSTLPESPPAGGFKSIVGEPAWQGKTNPSLY